MTVDPFTAADPRFARALEERLMRRVEFDTNGGCWLWTGRITRQGYGQAWTREKKNEHAHRVMWRTLRGGPPDDLALDHLCRVRCCVNPAHLEPVPNKVNILRGYGAPALNARRTHCVRGHPLFGANLMVVSGGRRQCRKCHRQRGRRSYFKTKLACEAA